MAENRFYKEAYADERRREAARLRKRRWRARKAAGGRQSTGRRLAWAGAMATVAALVAISVPSDRNVAQATAEAPQGEPIRFDILAEDARRSAVGIGSVAERLQAQNSSLAGVEEALRVLSRDVQGLASRPPPEPLVRFVQVADIAASGPPAMLTDDSAAPSLQGTPDPMPVEPVATVTPGEPLEEAALTWRIAEGDCLRTSLGGWLGTQGWHLTWDVPAVDDICDLSPAVLTGRDVPDLLRQLRASLAVAQTFVFHAWPEGSPPKVVVMGSGQDGGARAPRRNALESR